MAELAVKQYNKVQKLKLDFVSVLHAEKGNTPLDRHLLVLACDHNVGRVPVKLKVVRLLQKKDGIGYRWNKFNNPVQSPSCYVKIIFTNQTTAKHIQRLSFLQTLMAALSLISVLVSGGDMDFILMILVDFLSSCHYKMTLFYPLLILHSLNRMRCWVPN